MHTPWSPTQAHNWYARRPWPVGFNYVPSCAVNSIECWQAESFDFATIERELAWGGRLGFNTVRVFLPYLVWQFEAHSFKARIHQFLSAASANGLSAMFCLFDDCAFNRKDPWLGKQDEPVPGKMATGWTASPGQTLVNDRAAWPALERYVRDIVGEFAQDPRVFLWDLYNEPGNEGQGEKSLSLVRHVFDWARAVSPSQPLTSGVWNFAPENRTLNEALLDASDVVTFHSYAPLDGVEAIVAKLQARNRPILCTEYMARLCDSRFATHLPYFKSHQIGALHWGLVNGRMQTQFPWPALQALHPDAKEWFHDLLHPDGQPYATEEIEIIRACTGATRSYP